jgi:hypothetical protein
MKFDILKEPDREDKFSQTVNDFENVSNASFANKKQKVSKVE